LVQKWNIDTPSAQEVMAARENLLGKDIPEKLLDAEAVGA
jgi:hypothetical protein